MNYSKLQNTPLYTNLHSYINCVQCYLKLFLMYYNYSTDSNDEQRLEEIRDVLSQSQPCKGIQSQHTIQIRP